jgi:hypothetical protein
MRRESSRKTMSDLSRNHPAFKARHEVMRGLGNPIHDPIVREKIAKKLAGVPRPHLNGGNGSGVTLPQKMLLEGLGSNWTAEHVVWAHGSTPSSWPIMIVDLANIDQKWAIEVDGLSHNSTKVVERDKRKDALLREEGWQVFRVTNQQVIENLSQCLYDIQKFFVSK